MAEIILPPEENEETPQTPELNIDKPTENSKVITIEFEAKKTNKVSTKDSNQQLYTTDTDAWFEFKETSLEGANGTYSVVFRNRHDGSIFQRTGDVVSGVAYYKIPHQEIRHAGAWRGQVVYTLSNGDTTAREFDYDVKGHILDGKDVREIVVEDFETLMSQLRSMKDSAEVELANLTQQLKNTTDTAEQNETDRQAFFDDLVEDIDELQVNYQELLDTGVLQTNINTKLEALEEEYAPKLTEVTAQLAQTEAKKADKTYVEEKVDELEQKNDSLNTQLAQTSDVLNSRFDTIINLPEGTTTNDARLEDIKIGTDGEVYSSPGEAVRKQFMKTNEDVSDLSSAFYRGALELSKEQVTSKYEEYKYGSLLSASDVSIGKHIDDVTTTGSGTSTNYIIDVEPYSQITYPVFKTTSGNGSLMLDKNKVVIWGRSNATLDTGNYDTVAIPENAKYFVLSISSSLSELIWSVKFKVKLQSDIDFLLTANKDKTLTKEEVLAIYGKMENHTYISAINTVNKNIGEVTRAPATNAYLVKIDLTGYKSISYPVFKSSSIYGSLIIDENDVVIWENSEKTQNTGSSRNLLVPENSKYFILGISPSLSTMDWSVGLYETVSKKTEYEIAKDIEGLKETAISPAYNHSENRNLTLAALKTDITNNKMPFHSGYLFHKLTNDDRSLWYGANLEKISKIGTVDFYPRDCLLAMSPKDGRVIATKRGAYGSMFVWNGKETIELFGEGSQVRPKGWLYNAGVEFVEDEDGIEHCIFAEYSASQTGQTGGFNVWRGTYPYESESDWETVFFQDFYNDVLDITNSINHFHMVRRDPWTNIIYLTSGDVPELSKWWYSLDFGLTWTFLTSTPLSGFEHHACRTINFVFDKDYVYWATDYGENHSLNRIERNPETGIIDVGTRHKICDLPEGQATNSICYVEYPKGIFMFDRVDAGFEEQYGKGFDVQFWSIEDEVLYDVLHVDLTTSTWGGHRGKCYTNYTNGFEHRPAMGFADDSKCIFDVTSSNPAEIGTVFYEIKNGVMRFVTF